MNREQWNHELEIRPATPNQVGTIMSKFQSLDFHAQDERPWYVQPEEEWLGRQDRLSIISAMVNRDIDSIWELRQGEAGKLIDDLKNVQALDDLYALLPDEYWNDEESSQEDANEYPLAEGLALMGIAIYEIVSFLVRSYKQSHGLKHTLPPLELRGWQVGTISSSSPKIRKEV